MDGDPSSPPPSFQLRVLPYTTVAANQTCWFETWGGTDKDKFAPFNFTFTSVLLDLSSALLQVISPCCATPTGTLLADDMSCVNNGLSAPQLFQPLIPEFSMGYIFTYQVHAPFAAASIGINGLFSVSNSVFIWVESSSLNMSETVIPVSNHTDVLIPLVVGEPLTLYINSTGHELLYNVQVIRSPVDIASVQLTFPFSLSATWSSISSWNSNQPCYQLVAPYMAATVTVTVVFTTSNNVSVATSDGSTLILASGIGTTVPLSVGANSFQIRSSLDGWFTWNITRVDTDLNGLSIQPIIQQKDVSLSNQLFTTTLYRPFLPNTVLVFFSVPFLVTGVALTPSYTLGPVTFSNPSYPSAFVNNSEFITGINPFFSSSTTLTRLNVGNNSILLVSAQDGQTLTYNVTCSSITSLYYEHEFTM